MSYKNIIVALAAGAYLGNTPQASKVELSPQETSAFTELKQMMLEAPQEAANILIRSGSRVLQRLNKGAEAPDGYFKHPYDLRYEVEKDSEGNPIGYLVDEETGKEYVVYDGVQVGSVEHRIAGIRKELLARTKTKINGLEEKLLDRVGPFLEDVRELWKSAEKELGQ